MGKETLMHMKCVGVRSGPRRWTGNTTVGSPLLLLPPALVRTDERKAKAADCVPVTLGEDPIKECTEFVYLDATVSTEGRGDKDINNRLTKARVAFTKLSNVWQCKDLHQKTKGRLFKTLICPILLYGCKTWRLNKTDEKKLNTFLTKCLRRILKISREDHIPNRNLLERSNCDTITTQICRRRWRFIGHIHRKDCTDRCSISLEWRPEGKRKRGHPRTTWRRMVEKERTKQGWASWSQVRTAAAQQDRWRANVEALCADRHEED
ncbi:hypothetical protein GJAV_G00103460 [Gymnothorax javanicus]|nr:hypothetical protein GJAV_G00103460 [Gymnothorax javanicus]